MLTLSEDTEGLAHRLAEEQNRSVDDVVRRALEQQARSIEALMSVKHDRVSDEKIAQRMLAIEELQREFDALPILDHRPVQDIVDEVNEL